MAFLGLLVCSASVMFWLSAMLAELLFPSREEGSLPPAARIGFAYTLALVWFMSVWKVLPVGWVWAVGALVLALRVAGRPPRALAEGWRAVGSRALVHLRLYGWFVLALNAFLLPLHLTGRYGPFSEGGGDVTIYADAPKYLVDHGLPAYGLRDVLDGVRVSIAGRSRTQDPRRFDPRAGSAPAADYAAYDVVFHRHPINVYPTAMWSFLAGRTNAHVYYGTLAFYYALILLLSWSLFRPFGRFPAGIAVSLATASHGLASVAYNNYQNQLYCVVLLLLMANALPHVKLWSWAGFRTYGMCQPFLAIYMMFVPLEIPLLVLAAWRRGRVSVDADGPALTEGRTQRRRWMGTLAAAVFCLSALLLSATLLDNVRILTAGTRSSEILTYFGQPIPAFSDRWTVFLSGALSQQHFPPFAGFSAALDPVLTWIRRLFLGSVLLGLAAWWAAPRSVRAGEVPALYLAFLLTVAAYLAVVQASLYTQAKGAQNALVLLHPALVLPFAALWKGGVGALARALKVILATVLIAFGLALLVPRSLYAVRLGCGQDRASVLEPSYFTEASRILRQDANAFVWFEPRNSVDTYLGIQPFAGARMVPTRHLLPVRTRKTAAGLESESVLASDLVNEDDLPHLWTLTARTSPRAGTWWQGCLASDWRARQVTALESPKVLYAAAAYEELHSERLRSLDPADRGRFTYLRNGAALLYVPAGRAASAELRVRPVFDADYEDMARELERRAEEGSQVCGRRSVTRLDDVVALHCGVGGSFPRLLPLVRYRGEMWVNIRLDGRELGSDSEGTAPTP